ITRDGAARGFPPGGIRAGPEMQEAEHEVVRVLVLMTVLEGENLEDRVREHVRDPHRDLRPAAAIETLAFEHALDGVVSDEVGAADVEGPGAGTGRTGLGPEHEPGGDGFRLSQELDGDLDALDFARPPEPRLLRVEVRFLEVLLERAVRLRRRVAEGQ